MSLNRVSAADASYECSCDCGCLTRRRCYPTDLTDAQWAVLEPLLPVMLCLTVAGGRPELHYRRTMIDAMFYLVDNGIKWRAMPADYPPWRTIWGMHARWKKDGVPADLVDLLRGKIRAAAGRDPEPSAAVIAAQSVHESAEGVVPAVTSGYDSHKNVSGRKRHLLADTLGLLICVIAGPANRPDREAAALLVRQARRRGRTRLALVWADRAYTGEWGRWSARTLGIIIEFVLQPEDQQGFTVLPRRWVVERTHAWITRRRRCARDYERLPEHHVAVVQWAAILMMTRRLAKTSPRSITPAPARV